MKRSSLATDSTITTNSSRNTTPVVQGAYRERQLPRIAPLDVPPYKPEQRSLASTLWYKFNVETGLFTVEPWERALSAITVFVIAGYSAYLSYGAYMWFAHIALAELAGES